MRKDKSWLYRLDEKLDVMSDRLREKEVTVPTDLVGSVLFIGIAVIMLVIMPGQVPVSETDVVNGRVFPTMLMGLMIFCCGLLFVQNIFKIVKKQPVNTCRLNMLTEVKALIILGILVGTYFICRITDLFVAGAVFCCMGFLGYYRCRKKLYYGITLFLAVAIWAAFRFGLGVRF